MSGDGQECPFCSADIGRIAFAESRSFLAICNAAPILPGHSLLISKRHVMTILELSNSELSEMAILAKEVTVGLMRVYKATGFNWTIQQGGDGGQTVPHLHLHLIPRYSGDLPHPGDWYAALKGSETDVIDSAKRPRLSRMELEATAATIRNRFDFRSAVAAAGLS
jgi:bis(5'-adenosyl)-triphosphatase